MNLNIQNSFEACEPLIAKADNFGETGDVKDIYFLLDYLVRLTQSFYPQIPCVSGCSQCCEHNGLPRTSAREWANIEVFLRNEISQDTLAQVQAQNDSLHGDQKDILNQERQRLEAPEANHPTPKFDCSVCPFLIDQKCSVYPVRPSICRGYGYFSFRPPGKTDSQIFACRMAGEALIYSQRDQGIETIVLPVWNRFMERIYELNKGERVDTLPLWLFEFFDAKV